MHPSDWAFLPYFLAVARTGTLRAGAATLNVSYVTTRRNIEALEASFGTRLFTRSRLGFDLTESGEALLPIAEEAEKTFASARQRVQGLDRTETGTIRFSLPPSLAFDIVSPIIAKFSVAYPEIDIQLQVTSKVEDITRAETDVSLRAAHSVSDDVVARKLYSFHSGVYASQTYLDKKFAESGPGGAGLNWIGWTGPGADPAWLANSQFPQASIKNHSAEGYMHVCLVRNNCGMSRFPTIYEHIYPEIVRVPGSKSEVASTLWILLHTDLRRTLRVRLFVDFLAKELIAIRPLMQG
jgi:DNA-binding transcriptional LysR family regulator